MKIAKNILWVILIASLGLSACKSKRKTPKYDPPVAAPERVVEQIEPEPEPEPVPQPKPEPVVVRPEPSPVPVREEKVELVRTRDTDSHENKRYFVIMGSFRSANNAENFKTTLSNMGFKPFILVSEKGFHRVGVESTNDEQEGVRKVLQIRSQYPKHKDTWLLRKK